MARPKKKKPPPPPPHTSSPTDQPESAESPAPVSNIDVSKSQSDIVTGTPSILQATTGNKLVKQSSNIKNLSNQPSNKRKQTIDIWDHFAKKGTCTYLFFLS
ncbi:hypothetical protein PSHT_12683 [Puccinia striiformis]|uniref:Uncharacterized protein n=1 Tax=Puccinia striiformis TaxID=27350 RepID=A0A2S4UUV6_9BASI|nr:hypothetical protein PSHT_12683 [Puccinia striiformis]